MLAKLVLTLNCITDKKITTNMSSVFQGILMEKIDSGYAQFLHQQQRHPYSQSICYKENQIYWTISTVTQEAYQNIIEPFLDGKLTELYSEYHDISFKIQQREITKIEYSQFLEQEYFKNSAKVFDIEFLTPTSFKSNGHYMNYPTIRWIFQSLMNKHDSNDGDEKLFDEEILQLIEEQVSITQYKLRSTQFHLEGVKIPAFLGNIRIYARSNQSVVNLINYLLRYGEYTGVGIKSAIGMGAISIRNVERKKGTWTKEE